MVDDFKCIKLPLSLDGSTLNCEPGKIQDRMGGAGHNRTSRIKTRVLELHQILGNPLTDVFNREPREASVSVNGNSLFSIQEMQYSREEKEGKNPRNFKN